MCWSRWRAAMSEPSPRWRSSSIISPSSVASSPTGDASDTGSCETRLSSSTFVALMPISSASSSCVGSRLCFCVSCRSTRAMRLIVSTTCAGTRIVRPWSASAARHGLADPPRRVRRKPVPEPPVVALDGLHQADVALLDQVEERQAAAGVAPCDRHHEAQVGLDQPPARAQVAALERLGQRHLLGGGQQRHLRDLAQVHPDRVLGQAGGGIGLEVELDLFVRIEARRITKRVGGVLGHECGAY